MRHRAILHVDMDAFYASVEQRDDPALRGRQVIVGGHPTRGVVLAASYEVRPFGVRSAMPMSRALQKAPQAIVVPPRFSAYVAASEQVFAIFARYTPLCEPLSLDEAFLDVTGSLRLFGPAADIARRIRAEIRAETALPASAGIGPAKFIAKIASDLAKPDGQKEVPPEQVVAMLAKLPVGRLWGVGEKTEKLLHDAGLHTIGQVAARDAAWLCDRFGELGRHLHELSHGLDDRPVVPDREQKSLGAEDTFAEDLADLATLRTHIQGQALRVAARLRQAGLLGRVVQLKLKYADFKLVTRRLTLPAPSDDGGAIFAAAAELLGRGGLESKVRLTGVSVQDLQQGERQLSLFDLGLGLGPCGGPGSAVPAPGVVPEQDLRRRQRLNVALDEIARRYGQHAVVPADLAGLGAGDSDLTDEEDEARRQIGASRLDAGRRRS